MTAETAMRLSGLLFWLIIATNIGSNMFGYQTFGDFDSQADLKRIRNEPQKFKIGFALILIEHLFIVFLAITLFAAFGDSSVVLGTIWLVSRSIEGSIQILNKRNYWRLLNIASRYTEHDATEREALDASRLSILNSKHWNFLFAQVLFSIGTLAYSIMFVAHEAVPAVIGWFGIVAAILYGIGNLRVIANADNRVIWSIGGLLILLFETVLGGWLLFS